MAASRPPWRLQWALRVAALPTANPMFTAAMPAWMQWQMWPLLSRWAVSLGTWVAAVAAVAVVAVVAVVAAAPLSALWGGWAVLAPAARWGLGWAAPAHAPPAAVICCPSLVPTGGWPPRRALEAAAAAVGALGPTGSATAGTRTLGQVAALPVAVPQAQVPSSAQGPAAGREGGGVGCVCMCARVPKRVYVCACDCALCTVQCSVTQTWALGACMCG